VIGNYSVCHIHPIHILSVHNPRYGCTPVAYGREREGGRKREREKGRREGRREGERERGREGQWVNPTTT